MKTLAASLFSVWLLKRCYSKQQWISVCVLATGVMLLSRANIDQSRHASSIRLASDMTNEDNHQQLLLERTRMLFGIFADLVACSTGSAGAVIMEMTIKDAKVGIWIRNAQLAIFSLIPAGFAVLREVYKSNAWDPLQHF